MYVVLHGHFYQPPRENPWSGQVPRQESAHPAHDWNERVTDECYRPNARSRLQGANGWIDEIVNNYAFISFDFGPTLLSWLEQHSPRVYRQIIEGDRLSAPLNGGHGNAIAHVYNHVIMPLANYRDKRTQIVWGLRDFEWRFGRKSESIWLGETAINLETTKLLIEFGLRYVILSPYQALRIRPLDRSRGWTDASAGRIDPRRPYRFFLKDSRRHRMRESYIDVFFYDGPLAADVSFAHLLRNAGDFVKRLVAAGADRPADRGCVNVATDGEIYGHHEPFADMCLAYSVRREGPARDLKFTNYGHYLDLHPPEYEVDLNFGEHDEGTAWSCAHGVGRWERDCGCSTGAGPGWNQRWRTPLRRGFDMVRDRLIETYLEQISPLVNDPWIARDDYILVMLEATTDVRAAFLEQHARRDLDAAERRKLWSLLEAQRYAMYMYTSCGWFFADVSGIETVQNMAYACRAIELAQPWQSLELEPMLLDYLSDAKSNLPEMGTGADVYRRFVWPQRIEPPAVAGGLALGAAVLSGEPAEMQFRFRARTLRFERPGPAECHGLLELTDGESEEQFLYRIHVYGAGSADIRCYVLPGNAGTSLREAPAEQEVASESTAVRVTLADLIAENREEIIRAAYEAILASQDERLGEIYATTRDLIVTCRQARIAVPAVLKAIAGHILTRQLGEKARALEERLRSALRLNSASPPRDQLGAAEIQAGLLKDVADLLNFARDNELEVSTESLTQTYRRVILHLLGKLLEAPDPLWAEQCTEVIQSSYQLHFPLDRRPLEDLGFLVFGKHRGVLLEYAHAQAGDGERAWQAYRALAEALHLNIDWIIQKEAGTAAG